MKYVAPLTDERSPVGMSDLPYIGLEHVESGTGRLVRTFEGSSAESEGAESVATLFRPGDVLFGKLRPYLAKVVRPDFEGRCSTELLVLRSKGAIAPSLLAYQLLSRHFIGWVDAMTYGTKMPRANPDQVTNIRIALPSAKEQHAIATFLDRETGKIDALTAKKERLIELLHEKRAALITRAITKGLNSSVSMKDSGIAWLGEIPAHWKVKRLKYLGRAIIGLTYEPSDVVGPGQGTLVLRASNVFEGHIVLEDNVFVSCAIPDRLRTKLGDILVCSRSGSRALIGKSAKIEEAAVGLTFGTFMTLFRSSCNDYLFYTFNSKLFDYQSGTFLTSTINQLTLGNLNSLIVPVPPDRERSAIAEYLDREATKVDVLIERVSEAMNRLKELRTALISAAVTGKIDVRGEAA